MNQQDKLNKIYVSAIQFFLNHPEVSMAPGQLFDDLGSNGKCACAIGAAYIQDAYAGDYTDPECSNETECESALDEDEWDEFTALPLSSQTRIWEGFDSQFKEHYKTDEPVGTTIARNNPAFMTGRRIARDAAAMGVKIHKTHVLRTVEVED